MSQIRRTIQRFLEASYLVADSALGNAQLARRFAEAYLATEPDPLFYPYAYAAPSNTGLLSGLDLNGDGDHTDIQSAIEAATEKLSQASTALAQKMYAEQAAQHVINYLEREGYIEVD